MADPQKSQPTGKERWKALSLRSGFGRQVASNQVSAPGVGFGSADRDGFRRVRVLFAEDCEIFSNISRIKTVMPRIEAETHAFWLHASTARLG